MLGTWFELDRSQYCCARVCLLHLHALLAYSAFYLAICLPIHPPRSLCIYPSTCPFFCLSIRLSINASAHFPTYLLLVPQGLWSFRGVSAVFLARCRGGGGGLMSLLLFRCQVQFWILRLLLLRCLTVSPIDFRALCDDQNVLWSSWVSYVSRSRQALPLLLAAAAYVLSPRVPSSRCPPTLSYHDF